MNAGGAKFGLMVLARQRAPRARPRRRAPSGPRTSSSEPVRASTVAFHRCASDDGVDLHPPRQPQASRRRRAASRAWRGSARPRCRRRSARASAPWPSRRVTRSRVGARRARAPAPRPRPPRWRRAPPASRRRCSPFTRLPAGEHDPSVAADVDGHLTVEHVVALVALRQVDVRDPGARGLVAAQHREVGNVRGAARRTCRRARSRSRARRRPCDAAIRGCGAANGKRRREDRQRSANA